MVTCHSDVSHFAAALENSYAATIFQGLDAGTLALTRGGIEQHHVGNMDRRLFLHDPARHVLGRISFGMAFNHVHILDQHAVVRKHAQHRATFALVFPGIDDHLIALANLFHIQPNLTVDSDRLPLSRLRERDGEWAYYFYYPSISEEHTA